MRAESERAMSEALVDIAEVMRQRMQDPALTGHRYHDDLLDWADRLDALGQRRRTAELYVLRPDQEEEG